MSFWGATVITSLFSALDQLNPASGQRHHQLAVGGYAVGDATLNRFFALHYLLPFVIVGVVGCTSGRCTCRATTTRSVSR